MIGWKIENDPVPFVLASFRQNFPSVAPPQIIYAQMASRFKGMYDPRKRAVYINPKIPIGRVPEILAHELVHCGLKGKRGNKTHGKIFKNALAKVMHDAMEMYET